MIYLFLCICAWWKIIICLWHFFDIGALDEPAIRTDPWCIFMLDTFFIVYFIWCLACFFIYPAILIAHLALELFSCIETSVSSGRTAFFMDAKKYMSWARRSGLPFGSHGLLPLLFGWAHFEKEHLLPLSFIVREGRTPSTRKQSTTAQTFGRA